ncbi:vegetative cell wall protein gp1-like [Choloepus didactylus]|uniref:vegetative cell wall protein gp1-like n=1 Tax=Choloepus didactylus TaxID=27675 RepID=UPI00189D8C5B|nr:vegetative cell wall protein gp1-like [Choloepus didactylus]
MAGRNPPAAQGRRGAGASSSPELPRRNCGAALPHNLSQPRSRAGLLSGPESPNPKGNKRPLRDSDSHAGPGGPARRGLPSAAFLFATAPPLARGLRSGLSPLPGAEPGILQTPALFSEGPRSASPPFPAGSSPPRKCRPWAQLQEGDTAGSAQPAREATDPPPHRARNHRGPTAPNHPKPVQRSRRCHDTPKEPPRRSWEPAEHLPGPHPSPPRAEGSRVPGSLPGPSEPGHLGKGRLRISASRGLKD